MGYELPKTNQEISMTTAAGTVIQLMGSDEQFDLPVFPIVLAYNRINHYAPTQYLCDTSLADWRLAQMYRHLVCANDFYVESQVGLNDPALEKLLDQLNQQMEKVKLNITERAKRGLFAASSVPISMTGPNPKQSDPLARFAKVPQREGENFQFMKLPQPQFDLLPNCNIDETCVPDIFEEESSLTTVVSSSASASGGVPPPPPPGPELTQESSQPAKRKASKEAGKKAAKMARSEEVETVDDEDKDPDYRPPEESEEPEGKEEEDQPTLPLSQAESVSSGIPIGHSSRRGGKKVKDPARYPLACKLCPERYQKTNDLRDHHYVFHLNKTFDCADCMKQYTSKKALQLHFKLKHENLGRVKCTEDNCDWTHQDPGTLHNHLLTKHEIGEPIVCKLKNSDGKECNKVFINTRSFQDHKIVHLERNFECNICNRKFPTEESRRKHIGKYHPSPDSSSQFQCSICGKTFPLKSQLDNHNTLHKLHHHRQLKKQKEEGKEDEGTQEPVAGTSTSEHFIPETQEVTSASASAPGTDSVTFIPETQDQ